MEFESRAGYYVLAWALLGLHWWVWRRIQASPLRIALSAIGEDEVAAACCGVSVVKSKLTISTLSAALAAAAGTLYARYVGYINPATVAGVTLSLQVAFVAILGGMYAWYGAALGAVIAVGLSEALRVYLGSRLAGLSEVVYGLVVILLIVFSPRGLSGWLRGSPRAAAPAHGWKTAQAEGEAGGVTHGHAKPGGRVAGLP
jgi:branched-chain amino acid transport system permease protein